MDAGLLSTRETTCCGTPTPPTDATRPPDAFRVIYRSHAGPLLAYAKHLTGDRIAAEDAVQETFLRAWRELPRLLADDRSPRPWLRQVLRHLVIDAARRRQHTRPIDDSVLDERTDGGYDTVLDRELLAGSMAGLSSLHREVLVEVYLRDRPPDRVAASLGVPVVTVRSRLHYALDALRHQLGSGTPVAERA